MSQHKKENFRRVLRDFVENTMGSKLDSMDDAQRSRAMARCYATEILRITNPLLVPEDEDELDRCLVDGGHDKGVDFIFRGENRVLIIQCKYRKKNIIEELGDFEKLCSVVERLKNAYDGASRIRDDLLDVVADIDWHNDEFDLRFITLGRESTDIRAREDVGQKPIPQIPGVEDRASIRFLGETDLNEAIRDARSLESFVDETVELRLTSDGDSSAWLRYENSERRRSYVGRIAGRQVYNLVNEHRDKLFSMNIRNYLGNLTTNKGIIKSAATEPQNFYFFNNGISAVATEIQEKPDGILSCKHLSIINGAQTVNSIFRAIKHDSKRTAGEVEVLMRITEINYGRDNVQGGFLDNITQYNNTQNAIKISDFRSNDAVQSDLNRRFSKLQQRGKKCAYLNKRQRTKPNHVNIRMEEFAKAVHAFEHGPIDYFGGASYLFDTAPDKGYVKIFGENGTLPDVLTRERFEELAGIYFLCSYCQLLFKDERASRIEREKTSTPDVRAEPIAKKALERKWMLYFTLGEVLRARYRNAPESLTNALRKLHKPDWVLTDTYRQEVCLRYTKFASEILLKSYRAETKDPDFAHRNWFRKPRYLEGIRKEVEYSESMVDVLPDL